MAKFTYTPPTWQKTLFYDNKKKEFHSEYYPSISFEFSNKETFLNGFAQEVVATKPKIPLYFSATTIKLDQKAEDTPAEAITVDVQEIIQRVKQFGGASFPMNVGWHLDNTQKIDLSAGSLSFVIQAPAWIDTYKSFSNLIMITDKSDASYNDFIQAIKDNRDTMGKLFGIIAINNGSITNELDGLNFFFADYAAGMHKSIATSGYFTWNLPAEDVTENRLIVPNGTTDTFFNINLLAKDYYEYTRGIKVGVTGVPAAESMKVKFSSDIDANFIDKDVFALANFDNVQGNVIFDITQCVGSATKIPLEWLGQHAKEALSWIPEAEQPPVPPKPKALAKKRLIFNPISGQFDYIMDVSAMEAKIRELEQEIESLKQEKTKV